MKALGESRVKDHSGPRTTQVLALSERVEHTTIFDELAAGLRTVHDLLFYSFGYTVQLAESRFLDQGLNPGHHSEGLES